MADKQTINPDAFSDPDLALHELWKIYRDASKGGGKFNIDPQYKNRREFIEGMKSFGDQSTAKAQFDHDIRGIPQSFYRKNVEPLFGVAFPGTDSMMAGMPTRGSAGARIRRWGSY